MNTNRLPHILQTFPSSVDALPDRASYIAQINRYLPILRAKHPGTTTAVLYEAFLLLFGGIWEQLYEDKRKKGELKKRHVTWWESNGVHRAVSAEFYIENWRDNYAALAANWEEVASIPDNLRRITRQIMMGIAGLLYADHFEGAIFATIKYRQKEYPRQIGLTSLFARPVEEHRDQYGKLVKEIAEKASALQYPNGLNFLAELSGAYILSFPLRHIRRDSEFERAAQQYPAYGPEEVCVSLLLKYLCGYGSQEFAMEAADFPLHYMQKPPEDWKFIVELRPAV